MVCNEKSLDIRGRLALSSGVEVDQCIADTSNLTPVHGRFDAHFRIGRGNRTRAWGKMQPRDIRNGSERERRRPPSTDINISRIEGNERVDCNRWWGTTVALCALVGIIAGPVILRNKGLVVFQLKGHKVLSPSSLSTLRGDAHRTRERLFFRLHARDWRHTL